MNLRSKVCWAILISVRLIQQCHGVKDYQRNLVSANFTYFNPNDTYTPSTFVKYGHQLSGMEFGTDMAYLKRVSYAPIGLFVLGFLSVFFLDWGLLFRCCCNCCKCEPKRNDEHYARNRTCNYVWFYILCFLVLLFDQLVFIGNTNVNSGVITTRDTVDSAIDIIDNLYVQSYALGQYGVDLQSEITDARSDCPQVPSSNWDDMDDSASSIVTEIGSLSDQMKSIEKDLVHVNHLILVYAVTYRVMGMWILWGLSIVSVIFLLLSHFCRSIVGLQLSMFLSQVTFLIYILLGVLWCYLTSLLGDLCMEPSYNIAKNAPTAQDIVIYYSTCVGSSQFQENIQTSLNDLHHLNQTLHNATMACPTSTAVPEMEHTITQMYASTLELNSGLDCPPIQAIWFDIINKGLCTQLYTGFFYIWGSQLITSFLLFCLVLTAAYTHQFYPKKGVSPDSDEEADAELEHPAGHHIVEGEDENDFVQNYKKKQAAAESNQGGDSAKQEKVGHHHKVVDKNHHMPHQVQVQESDDEFFV